MARRALALLAVSLAAACASTTETPPPTPAPVILVPANGALLGLGDLTSGEVTFSGTAVAGASVVVQVANVGVCQVTAAANGTWTCTATLTAGSKEARAVATASGGVSPFSALVAFTLDLTRPAAPIITTPAGTTNATAFTVDGTAEANAKVGLYLDGAFQTTVAAAAGTGAFQGTVTLPGVDGPVGITAVAVDAARNASDPSAITTVTVDRAAPPVPAITAPAAGAHLAGSDLVSGQVAISGTAAAGATVEVQLDGVHLATVTATGAGTWVSAATLGASGRYTAGARAVDAAGNPSAFTTTSFTLSVARLAGPVSPPAPQPVASWAQTVPDAAQAFNSEVFPGQANTWVVDADFKFAEGFGGQYRHALQVGTGAITTPATYDTLVADFTGTALAAFPYDQQASEVTYLSPRFGTADGVRTAAASDGFVMGLSTIAGARSGFLNGTSDSRLMRTLTFDPAHVYTISWTHEAFLASGLLGGLLGADVAPFGPRYQVVLRDPANAFAQLGDPLFVSTTDVFFATEAVSISGAVLPAQAVLSFELHAEAQSYAAIDLLTVDDGSGPVAPINAGFEAGLDPWVASSGAESQNVRSGSRSVGAGGGALAVTRTIYAPPAATWARVVDVFENQGATTVTTSAAYATSLGGFDPIAAVTVGGAAVVGWDTTAGLRDVGIVFGSGAAWVWDASATSLDRSQIFVVHDLVVPPGGRAALVHFVVQLGEATGGLTAADIPANTSAICARIANGFPTVDAYWDDLEPGVMQAIRNF